MQKINLTFLIYIFLFKINPIYASEIKKIDVEKRQIIIDSGDDEGFKPKTKICFYEMNKKIGCGEIKKSQKDRCIAKVKSKKTFERLKVGMDVKINESIVGVTDQKSNSEDNQLISISSTYALTNPITAYNLSYDTPESVIETDALWKRNGPVKLFGGIIEWGLNLPSTKLRIGTSFKRFVAKTVLSDYKDTIISTTENEVYYEEFTESKLAGQTIGLFSEFYYSTYQSGAMQISLGNGLDIESSALNFISTQKSQIKKDQLPINTVGDIYKIQSKLNAIFFKTQLLLDFDLGSIGFQFKGSFLIPIAQKASFSLSENNDSPDFTNKLKGKTIEEDIKESLQYKASNGFDIAIGGYYNF